MDTQKPNGELERQVSKTFLDRYNKEIDKAETEIDSGNYCSQIEVEKLLADRRKHLSDNDYKKI